jgi:hypothetical protein
MLTLSTLWIIKGIILAIVAFLGIITGYFLCLIAPEEIKEGYKYFISMQNILFSIIASVLVMFFTIGFTSTDSWLIMIIIPIILGVIVFFLLYWKNIVGSIYIFIGIPLYVLRDNADYLLTMSSLIFLIGIPIAGIAGYDYVKNEKIQKLELLKKLIIRYIWFVPATILPFILSY